MLEDALASLSLESSKLSRVFTVEAKLQILDDTPLNYMSVSSIIITLVIGALTARGMQIMSTHAVVAYILQLKQEPI